MEKLADRSGLLVALGGCAFSIFWLAVVFAVELPWTVSLPFHALAMLLLGGGIVGLQARQAAPSEGASWVRLVAVLMVISLPISFEGFMVLLMVFVTAAFKIDVLRRLGAAMLGIGAVMFLTGRLMHGPFWSEGDPVPEGGVALLLGTSLVVLASGWAVLGRKGRSASGDDGSIASEIALDRAK